MYKLIRKWRLSLFITTFLFFSCGKSTPFQDYPKKTLLAQVETAKGENIEGTPESKENDSALVTQGKKGGQVGERKRAPNHLKRNYNRDNYMSMFGMAIFFWLLSKWLAPGIEKELITYEAGNLRKVEYNVETGSRFLSWILRKVAWVPFSLGVLALATDYKVVAGAVFFMFLIKKFLYKYKPKLAILTISLILVATCAYIWKTEFSSFNKMMEAPSKQLSINATQKVGDAGKYKLTILAAHDKLSPVRITVDEEIRRPYWVEHGEAIQINWNKKITIEGNLTVTELALNGFLYSLSSPQTKISLTDIVAEDFLNATLDK